MKKKAKTTRTRKTKRTKRKGYLGVTNISKSPWPAFVIRRLKYSQRINIGSANPLSQTVFRANSIYDPDLTGGGHQPYGHDQIATQYATYFVLKSRIKVEFAPSAYNNIARFYCRVINTSVDSGGLLPTSTPVETLLEMVDGGNIVYMGQADERVIPFNYARLSYSSKKKYKTAIEQDLGAAIGANPNVNSYFTVCAAAQDGASITNIFIRATIWYDVLFYNRLHPDGS